MRPHEFIIPEVAHERERQVREEGWTPEHDDEHRDGELAVAAACYARHAWSHQALAEADYRTVEPPEDWPWAPEWWKPRSPRRDLIRAAALIVAEVERLDRAFGRCPERPQEGAMPEDRDHNG